MYLSVYGRSKGGPRSDAGSGVGKGDTLIPCKATDLNCVLELPFVMHD